MICPDCGEEVRVKRIWILVQDEFLTTDNNGKITMQSTTSDTEWQPKHITAWCDCRKCPFVIEGDHIIYNEEDHE